LLTKLQDRTVRIGFDDEGEGEPVILLHSSSSSRRQWRRLKQEIGSRYRFLALDLYGYGDTDFPEPSDGFVLEQEVALVEHVISRIEGRFHLVGHSYGGAVAMKIALKYRDRVRSLYVHEPVAFSLLRMEGLLTEWEEIQRVCAGIASHVQKGFDQEAAELFIDYWGGQGTWAAIPNRRKPVLARSARKVVLDFTALFGASDSLSAYAKLTTPVRVTAGATSPSPARRVAELLGRAFGDGSLHVLDGVGHMAPVTDPEQVNPHIISHLAAHAIS
jgi:pimeloyl-ACP methyl ester carboxylesterase